MAFNRRGSIDLWTTAGAFVAVLIAQGPARSDLKIVSGVTITRSSADTQSDSRSARLVPPSTESKSTPQMTVTTYYQGQQARVEAADGTVTIYDRSKGNVSVLHPADKTYSVVALRKILEQGPSPTGGPLTNGRMNLETKVDLTQDKESEKQTFAGKEAIRYSLSGSVAVKRESRGGFSRGGFPGGGRFPGRGRFPGGGFPGGGYPGGGSDAGGRRGGSEAYGRRMPPIQIEGEYWIAAAPSLGTKTKNPLLPSFVATIPAGPFLSPLSDKLGKAKGFPVASKVTVTTTSRRSDTPTTVTTTTKVISITEGPLDVSLFKVPNDYKKVDAQPVSVSQNTGNIRR